MSKRKAHIPAKEKLAAALLMCMRPDESGKLVRLISHEEAKHMTADQIISLFQFDHFPITEQQGGQAVAWNLEPRPIIEHRKKTATVDTPARAKAKRLAKKEAQHQAVMAAKYGVSPAGVPLRPAKPKGKAVMPGSRASKWKRKVNGSVERRV